MNIENQVCSLPLAKRLKELNVPQDSLFAYATYFDEDDHVCTEVVRTPGTYSADYYSAFTVGELGEMLPRHCYTRRQSKKWRCWATDFYQEADTEADARAAMLMYLITNGLMPESLPAQKGEDA